MALLSPGVHAVRTAYSRVGRLRGLLALDALVAALAAASLLAAVGLTGFGAVVLAALAILGAVVRALLTVRLVSALAERSRLSQVDELTGLPDRRAFLDALDVAASVGSDRFAVVVIGLDELRELNSTLGHHAGDLVLQRLAGRLADVSDEGTLVARLGGNEFGLLVRRAPHSPGAEHVRSAAQRLLHALRLPLAVDRIELALDGSIGIALYPEDASDGRTLLRLADVAINQAKGAPARVALYRRAADPHTRERLALVAQLRQAIQRRELAVHYQPQLDLATGALAGLEALVRWPRDGRMLGPGEFLPVAERCGLMPALTNCVLEAVVTQQARWLRTGIEAPVAINLSVSDLSDPGLVELVRDTLDRAQVPSRLLQVEVTEHLLMSDPTAANAILQRLRAIGVRVALDDFGTGHSSLAYVQGLALDSLKIDRRFVTEMCSSPGDTTIIRVAIELARAFDLEVIAEGVESHRAAAALAPLGCDVIQGHWVSPPLPADDVQSWIDHHEPRRWAAA